MIDIESVPRSPYGDELPDQRLIEETRDVRALEVARGIYIGFTLLNRHLLGESSAVVAIGGFMSSLTSPDRAYEGVQLAALDRPILMLDLPGHGLSSPHSSRQIKDLCLHKSAHSQAEPLTEAVERLIPHDEIDYFGISHGSLMSLLGAEQSPEDRVRHIFGIDLPAVNKRSTLGLQIGYIITDGLKGRKKYLEKLEDSDFEKDFEAFKLEFDKEAPEPAPSFIRKNTGLFILNLISSINAGDAALISWDNILKNKTTKIDIVTSEYGSISSPEVLDRFIAGLRPEYQKRSNQVVIAGEDHNIGIVHLMPRAVSWAKSAYENQLQP